ncbi:ClpP/crotonase [Dacryopinax primogenitus]|uniref:ClpP/crotonase n=1 Tax=Dacryopinax primogenitus (strain DJM 731) TaxID=1858805 RepID=M5G369_DACPD|nr:ClpP/crotonase [Dacryopinax primogenitus]EJU04666.1 ClpP/crotonase [Dacryopinax primogenitus]
MSTQPFPISLPVGNPMLTLSRPSGTIFQIELHNGDDSRLTRTFLEEGFMPLLDLVEEEWRRELKAGKGEAALVIVGNTKQDKFFSNGLDYENAIKQADFFPMVFNPWVKRLLTFPMPTVCAMNGHAFAAGFLLALCCDYRVLTAGRAWCCFNEVLFGAPLPPPFAQVIKVKLVNPGLVRKCALEGHRFVPKELESEGVVDVLVDGKSRDILQAAIELAQSRASLAKPRVWGKIKEELYREVIIAIDEGREVRRPAKL